MKTENMKLLDLQTGKYLELGKDFYYGGDHIVVNKCNVGYQIYEAIQRKDSERLSIDNKDCPFAAEPPLELKEICEKVGAVVYGGRYVLFLDQEMGSVYNIKNEYRGEEFIDYKCKNGDFSSGYNIYNNVIITFLGNPFEEYSKQLRNEPNKFDELKQYKI